MDKQAVDGLAFKQLRVGRGFSLKEAAGDSITPQTVGRFERGESGISYQNLMRLLNNIGIDYEIFNNYKSTYFPTDFTKMQTEITELSYKKEYAKILEVLKQPFEDEPYDSYMVVAHRALCKYGVAEAVGYGLLTDEDKAEIDFIKKRLVEIEDWQKVEYAVYGSMIHLFEIPFILRRVELIFERLSGPTTLFFGQTKQYLFIALRGTVKYLSGQGYYEEAERIAVRTIEFLEKHPGLSDNLLETMDMIFQRACNFLRQDDPKGLELAKDLFTTLSAFDKLADLVHIRTRREMYFQVVTDLNKTGQPFLP